MKRPHFRNVRKTLNAQSRPCQELVRRRCVPVSKQWWDTVVATFTTPFPRDEFAKAYTRAARMLGGASLELDLDEIHTLTAAGLPPLQGHALYELGRIVLVLCAVEQLVQDEQAGFIDELYVRGDNAEREALLRSLSLLPEPARFLLTAVEACRTNVQTVFEAIACENPYPARHFPELNFNQMVMKAIFDEVPLQRIVGLSTRITPELTSMAKDYVRERTAAGRSLPNDIGLITSSSKG